MIIILFAFLVLVVFLIVLNGFLRGSKKKKIDAGLSFLLVGSIIATFIFGNWKIGLLAIAVAYFSSIILYHFAAHVAAKLKALPRDFLPTPKGVGLPTAGACACRTTPVRATLLPVAGGSPGGDRHYRPNYIFPAFILPLFLNKINYL
ncbi:hypothetical protein SAMN04244560_01032 [Thermoanaerobacter thermohydrosulfuricus]|uniref:Uncharacterized protein n=1 Tax=Thermoanaerobacter thermohydrosulfuricus TaxID=1516 RepID=A0A1G7MV67_THETY|nr:hypothetical protein [Thermoanaerobacter thermohydrosulfuricus]SDF65663.1 hypothetical protein SAMN04244560_01032 [Thermoanaerobacter thermohydrosulfuricus]